MRRAAAAAAVSVGALCLAAGASGATALLPSPTTPIDTKLPLGSGSVALPPLLPVNARVANRVAVSVRVLPDGRVVGVRALQRLTMLGTGDFFFQVPAPLRDVAAGPGSEGEPGFRRNAILWQGFADRRRILSADAELVTPPAAAALPLRLELADGLLRLRNVTAVRARAFSANAEPAAARRVLAGIASDPTAQPSIRIQGAVVGRSVVVEAPLLVRGVVRSGDRVTGRFERVLGGPGPSTVELPADGSEVVLTAEPIPLVPEARRPPRNATGPQLVLLATTSLLRLARTHQYDMYLANPMATGPTQTVYRYRTVQPSAEFAPPSRDEGASAPVTLLLLAGGLLAACGLVVLWARS
jgi:hypothetical protein